MTKEILSQKNKEILQIDNKSSYYKTYQSKTNRNITWRCINDKQNNNRSKAVIITNNNKEIINWDNEHNHLSECIIKWY